ncbi:MAG: hypothetical protein JKY02_00180 [Flavobacteriaceae bacterium]|nr:hypothetical protein [Flavobacteriaceae bacterium]
MKKTILRTLLLVGLISLNSCEQNENPQFDNVNGQTMVRFVNSSATLPVEPTGVTSQDLEVHVTTVSDTDRTVNLEIDATSTATSNQYTINDIVIPAGQYVGVGSIIGNYANLPTSGSVDLIVKITGVSGGDSFQENATYTLTLERFCPLVIADFYGTYNQARSFNDFGNETATGDATISAGPAPGTLLITNLYAGGRSAVIELDFSNPASPAVIYRSQEFAAVFATFASTGPLYTYGKAEDAANNTFNTCTKTISLNFFRTNGPSNYGGEYGIKLVKQ